MPAKQSTRMRRHRFSLRMESLELRMMLAADLSSLFPGESAAWLEAAHVQTESPGVFRSDFGRLAISPPDESMDVVPGHDHVYPLESVPILHSNPTAAKKIFLDFDGHVVLSEPWTTFNNDLPIHAPPYTIDGDFFTFTQQEINNIIEIWERMAEDFAPFNVDVTTEDPGEAFFAAGGQGIRVMMSSDIDEVAVGGTGNQWFFNAGGVAYLGSWNWTDESPVWVFSNRLQTGNPKRCAEAGSHEVGHSVDLLHDGTTAGVTYYRGHGDGETGWAPIMGVGYDRNLSQWSKGEYLNANNTEDDVAIIASYMSFRTDDHSNQKTNAAAATPLQHSAGNLTGSGIISQRTDVDVFRFEVTLGGQVQFQISPHHVGPNLDILAELFNSNGQLVASSNPVDLLSASFDLTLAPGVYTLAIDGVGKGNLVTGYSDYGSLGQYTINGSIPYALTGDFNNDATVDATDIDLLCAAIMAGTNDPLFDLTGDGLVNSLDMDNMIHTVLQTEYGDANLDRFVDGSDFGSWNANKFSFGGWAKGNFNCDLVVDGSDFNIWNAHKFTGTGDRGHIPAWSPAPANLAQLDHHDLRAKRIAIPHDDPGPLPD